MSAKLNVRMNVGMVVGTFEKSFSRSRKMVKSEIAKDCDPLIPFRDGTLKKSATDSIGRDDQYLIWNSPYAHYQYEGKLMVAPNGSAWARKYQTKHYKNPTQMLTHTKGRESEWFEVAKRQNLSKWLKIYAKGANRYG